MAPQLIYLIFLSLFTVLGSISQNECQVEFCTQHGPAIRFPFSLKDRHQQHCGYPGFELHCTQNDDTVLELPFPVKASIKDSNLPFLVQYSIQEIDYENQVIVISQVFGCFPGLLPILNLSASPFQFLDHYLNTNFTLFNCSKIKRDPEFSFGFNFVTCLSSSDYDVCAVTSDYYLYKLPLQSCSKMFDIQSIPWGVFDDIMSPITLEWSIPSCGYCESIGKHCRLKNDSSILHDTECYSSKPEGPVAKLRVAGEVLGPLLAVFLTITSYWIYSSIKLKKESELKIEQFLMDYKALKPTRYSYAGVKRITDNFIEKLGEGGYGTVYKGKLSNDVFVAIKILNNSKENGEDFINEVGTIGRIHHVNVVRLVGYCADGFTRALVYEFMPNDSLQKFISSEKQRSKLGWEKLHRIAVDIAKGVEYLHQGCEQRILHFDIKPNNILLDDNFNPKISDFGLAKLCSKEQSIVSMTAARGTIGYIAPEVFSRNFGNVSYKSDVYSFGMLLLEMVGGLKKNDVGGQDKSQVYFPEWIYNKLEHREEIAIQIEKESDNKIVRKLTIVGLWCIQWYPVERPSMKVVIQMLESEETPSMPRNPFTSTNGTQSAATAHGRIFNSELEIISESE
ncbi:rust resistance kinase Lr10-like [Olea europaea subsp. europaea]|uniref:Rust resistance kinase Lr10-like n=1 Tax=Olea europaea subsp. europaea TaxID=158383 RepID=A0A8S0T4Y3_OLEEU|nr:rust resistance kinase Lr10-like [Olea europaea subsp. europaea]